MTNQKIDFSKLLWSRGYIIYPTRYKLKAPHEFWKMDSFGANSKYTIQYDPKNEFAKTIDGNHWVAILGLAMDTQEWHMDLNKIAQKALKALKISKTDFYNYIDWLGGRHIIIFGTEREAAVVQDAGGMRSLYYESSKKIIASHYELINTHINSEYHPYWEVYNAIPNEVRPWCMPGAITPYKDIFTLLPNHKLNLKNMQISRFWPRKNHDSITVKDAINFISFNIKNQVNTLSKYKKIAMSITRGNDSKLSLAAAREIKDKIEFFTYLSPSKITHKINLPDIKYTEKLARNYNLNYKKIILDEEPLPQIRDISAIHHYHYSMPRTIHHYLQEFPDHIHVRSMDTEIIRARSLYKLINKDIITIDEMIEFSYKNVAPDPMCREIFEDFYKTFEFDKSYNYRQDDLYYWEYRLGVWQAGGILLESDMAFDTYNLFNCRKTLEIGLSIPGYYTNKNIVVYEGVNILWPELLFNLPNSDSTLYDYYDIEQLGQVNFTESKISSGNILSQDRKVSAFTKIGVLSCALGFSKPSVIKGDYIELELTRKFEDGKSYAMQFNILTPYQSFIKSGICKYSIIFKGKKIYETDCSSFITATNQINILYKHISKNKENHEVLKIIIRLEVFKDYTTSTGNCGFIDIKHGFISIPKISQKLEGLVVHATKDFHDKYQLR